MKKLPHLLPFLAGWLVLLLSVSFQTQAAINGALQIVLFLLVVCIPTWRTGRMSYVDIGWPWGLVVIGAVTWSLGEGDPLRVAVVSGLYALIGGRMGFFALELWRAGVLDRELARYRYQALRWERAGIQDVAIAKQIEVLAQGLANASILAVPAILVAANPSPRASMLEIIGGMIVITSFALESIADQQKLAFLKASKQAGERDRVCNVGLWRYSRHPNYFFEWMVWNGLIVMAIPSISRLFTVESPLIAWLLIAALLMVSRTMYQTLVYYTGARPAEYYSLQKRPDYAEYQRTTNRFFPGPQRQ